MGDGRQTARCHVADDLPPPAHLDPPDRRGGEKNVRLRGASRKQAARVAEEVPALGGGAVAQVLLGELPALGAQDDLLEREAPEHEARERARGAAHPGR